MFHIFTFLMVWRYAISQISICHCHVTISIVLIHLVKLLDIEWSVYILYYQLADCAVLIGCWFAGCGFKSCLECDYHFYSLNIVQEVEFCFPFLFCWHKRAAVWTLPITDNNLAQVSYASKGNHVNQTCMCAFSKGGRTRFHTRCRRVYILHLFSGCVAIPSAGHMHAHGMLPILFPFSWFWC